MVSSVHLDATEPKDETFPLPGELTFPSDETTIPETPASLVETDHNQSTNANTLLRFERRYNLSSD
jgi:hypothetical protein